MGRNSMIDHDDSLRQHWVTTTDGVRLNVLETGHREGRAILFVHGISQSWRSWHRQFDSAGLRASHRLIAFDLRGHGRSQAAIGAFDDCGAPFTPLGGEFFNDGNSAATSSRWASDVIAVIEALGLEDFLLVGWSYGGVVAQDYLVASDGLGKARTALLLSTIPGLRAPGTPEIGGDLLFKPAAIGALIRTTTINPLADPTSLNDGRTIIGGLADFLDACAADVRPNMNDEELLEALAFNVLTPASVRLAIIGRDIDNRRFFSGLSSSDQKRIVAIIGDHDDIFHSETVAGLWRANGIDCQVWPGEGHLLMSRNSDRFNQVLLELAR